MSKLRAIGIIRVSRVGGREGESFASPDEQRARIEAACARDDLALVETFEELDVSGGLKLQDRPGLSRAIAALEAGQAEVVVAAYFDRLFRSLATQAEVVERVERAGGRLLAVDVGDVRSRTAGEWLSGTMLGAVSEYYRRSAQDRSRQTADSVFARGAAIRAPFGYVRNAGTDGQKLDPELDGKALVPDAETAEIVKGIFQRRADGHSWASIAGWLDEKDVRPTRGGEWRTSTLRNLIANETYTGALVIGARRRDGAHDALVSRALFDAAQSTQTVQRTGRNAAGVAGGLLVCESCGKRLSVTGTNPTYTCRRTINGHRCERPAYISRDRADALLEAAVVEVLSHGSLDVVQRSRDVDELRERAAEAEAELQAYVVAASALDARTFRLGLEARQEVVDAVRGALTAATAGAEAAAVMPDVSGWGRLDVDARRRIARVLIDRVIVRPPASSRDRGPHADVGRRLEIVWNGTSDSANTVNAGDVDRLAAEAV